MKNKRNGAKEEYNFSPRMIVVAFDASLHSIRALRAAMFISERYGASIIVIHCVEFPIAGYGDGEIYFNLDKYYSAEKKSITKALSPIMKEARESGIRIRSIFTAGTTSVAESLLLESKKISTDLIVMGSRVLGGFKSLLLGSVSNAVVAHSALPVLIVK
jgi:nucleotide-binding universal stress UspA family protein